SVVGKILDRLDRVKSTSSDTWIASCPTNAHPHGDRSRGLSIRAVDDRVLIFCHAGCGAGDVVAALGFTLADLYDRPAPIASATQNRQRVPTRDLLELISEETAVVAFTACDMLSGKRIDEVNWKRLATAANRIHRARDHAYSR